MAAFSNKEISCRDWQMTWPTRFIPDLYSSVHCRFDLVQLHQLRGQLGLGDQASQCFILCSTEDSAAKERLSILERSSNGFEIAEWDLKARGTKDVFGPGKRLGGESQVGVGDSIYNTSDSSIQQQHQSVSLELKQHVQTCQVVHKQRLKCQSIKE